jgi:peptide/nickel transport system substrate-binding protein
LQNPRWLPWATTFEPEDRVKKSLLSLVLALALIAAACGGDDGGSDGDGEISDDPAAESGDPDEGVTPVYGGTLVFGREAETPSAWVPSVMTCELTCHQSARSVYDPLTYLDEDDLPRPFLLESIEPNEDFTVWTLVARPGITFHDGTPFDADAVMDHLQRMRDSFLVGRSLLNVEDQVKVDDMTVELTMGESWATFPFYLSGQPGYVASPTWLAAVDAGEADATEPVGTGPFEFAEFQPNITFRVTRNADYWLTDGEGNEYPYLDEIEFKVIEDDLTRVRALQSGEIDITHVDRGETILELREEVEAGNLDMWEITDAPTVTYALLNLADEDSPVSDVRIRRAMAHGIDQDLRNQARTGGVFQIANGPFSPGTPGYIEDNGFPTYDPEQATALIEEYKEDTGADEVVIRYETTADSENKATAELLQQMWEEVGFSVEIAQVEQGENINNALNGTFQVFAWRNHGGYTPDTERVWWHSETALPVGEIALNFGRIEDEVIDEALDELRASDDPAVIDEAAQKINQRFADQVYDIWFDWVYWAIPHKPEVRGVQTPLRLPDGTPSVVRSVGFIGSISTTQIWIDPEA